MDRSSQLAKLVERCPWCGGRVQIVRASEPGEITLIACNGTPSGDSPCTWSVHGAEADAALEAAYAKRPA